MAGNRGPGSVGEVEDNRGRLLIRLHPPVLIGVHLSSEVEPIAAQIYKYDKQVKKKEEVSGRLIDMQRQFVSPDHLKREVRQSQVLCWTGSDGTVLLFRHLYIEFKDYYSVDFYTDTVFPVIGLCDSSNEEIWIEEEVKLKEFENDLQMRLDTEQRLIELIAKAKTVKVADDWKLQLEIYRQKNIQTEECFRSVIQTMRNDISPIPQNQMNLLLRYSNRVGLALMADPTVQRVSKFLSICNPLKASEAVYTEVLEETVKEAVSMSTSSHWSLSANLFCFIIRQNKIFFGGIVGRILDMFNIEFQIIGMFGGRQYKPLSQNRLLLDVKYNQKNEILISDVKCADTLVPKIAYIVSQRSLLFVSEIPRPDLQLNTLMKGSTFVLLDGNHNQVLNYNGPNPDLTDIGLRVGDSTPYALKVVIIGEGVNAMQVRKSEFSHPNDYYVTDLYLSSPDDTVSLIDWRRFERDFQRDSEVRIGSTFRQVMNINEINDCLIEWYEPFNCWLLFSLFKRSEFKQQKKQYSQESLAFLDSWNVFIQIAGDSPQMGFYCYYKVLVVRYAVTDMGLKLTGDSRPFFIPQSAQEMFGGHTIIDPRFQRFQSYFDRICNSFNTFKTNVIPFQQLLEKIASKPVKDYRNPGYYTRFRFLILSDCYRT